MRINWTKILNNLVWFIGAVGAFIVLILTFGKKNIMKPKNVTQDVEVKPGHETINVDPDNVGDSDFKL